MGKGYRMSYRLEGVSDIQELMKGMDFKTQVTLLTKTVEQAGKPIVSLAKTGAPVRSGALRKALGMVVRRYKNNHLFLAIIGARKGDFGMSRNASGIKSRKLTGKHPLRPNEESISPENYIHLVELGHMQTKGEVAPAFTRGVANTENEKTRRNKKARDKTFIKGRPFLRPAFEAGKAQAETALMAGFQTALARVWSAQIRKISKTVTITSKAA